MYGSKKKTAYDGEMLFIYVTGAWGGNGFWVTQKNSSGNWPNFANTSSFDYYQDYGWVSAPNIDKDYPHDIFVARKNKLYYIEGDKFIEDEFNFGTDRKLTRTKTELITIANKNWVNYLFKNTLFIRDDTTKAFDIYDAELLETGTQDSKTKLNVKFDKNIVDVSLNAGDYFLKDHTNTEIAITDAIVKDSSNIDITLASELSSTSVLEFHYTRNSDISHNIKDALGNFTKDIVHDTIPPILNEPTFPKIEGNKIVMMFDGKLEQNSAFAGFSATTDGENNEIIAKEIVFSKLILTFKKLLRGTTVLSYSKPAQNKVKDFYGNELANFSKTFVNDITESTGVLQGYFEQPGKELDLTSEYLKSFQNQPNRGYYCYTHGDYYFSTALNNFGGGVFAMFKGTDPDNPSQFLCSSDSSISYFGRPIRMHGDTILAGAIDDAHAWYDSDLRGSGIPGEKVHLYSKNGDIFGVENGTYYGGPKYKQTTLLDVDDIWLPKKLESRLSLSFYKLV